MAHRPFCIMEEPVRTMPRYFFLPEREAKVGFCQIGKPAHDETSRCPVTGA